MLGDEQKRRGVVRKTDRLMKEVFYAQFTTLIAQYEKYGKAFHRNIYRSLMSMAWFKKKRKPKQTIASVL